MKNPIKIHWVPGHTYIPDNEAADQAAKEDAYQT
jgi:ribonuclease HI